MEIEYMLFMGDRCLKLARISAFLIIAENVLGEPMRMEGESLRLYREIQDRLRGVESWRERAKICDPNARLHEPAPAILIEQAEEKLHVELPRDLKNIYAESNGIFMNSGANTIMKIEDLIHTNLDLRNPANYGDLYMPFDNLLFFGEAGNGDLWAFGIKMNGDVDDLNLFAWNHENDARPCIACHILDMMISIGSGNLYDAF